jgi:hypothetical protein
MARSFLAVSQPKRYIKFHATARGGLLAGYPESEKMPQPRRRFAQTG